MVTVYAISSEENQVIDSLLYSGLISPLYNNNRHNPSTLNHLYPSQKATDGEYVPELHLPDVQVDLAEGYN